MLYEQFPYPSPDIDAELIQDVANGVSFLLTDRECRGWQVLDVGCGTGHRLVALALRFPQARFLGVDASANSLAVARRLAEAHGLSNVEFRHGTLPDLELPRIFDLVVCTGVLHHVPDPKAALRWIRAHLTDDGLLYLWLYHAIGEHDRMVDRELVQLLVDNAATGGAVSMMQALRVSLSETRYGNGATADGISATTRLAMEADAFLNPIVEPLRFGDVPLLFEDTGFDWVAAVGVNTDSMGRVLDLGAVEEDPYFVLTGRELFDTPELGAAFGSLGTLDRLRAIELKVRPTGFTLVAGRGTAIEECAPRVAGNVIVGADVVTASLTGQSHGDRRRRRMVRVELAEQLHDLRDRLVERWGADAMRRVVAGIDMATGRRERVLSRSGQRPALFHLLDLPSEPWVDPAGHPELAAFCARLEAAWREILAELDGYRELRAGTLSSYLDGEYMSAKFDDREPGEWLSLDLFTAGRVTAGVVEHCPVTAALLTDLAPTLSGDVMLSRLRPGTHLPPHHDDNDYKLTVHLGLRIPADCGLRVGGEARTWQAGRCFAFSDAYLHEAWNNGDQPREILLIDVWHPGLSAAERAALGAVRGVLAPACEPAVFDRF